MSGGELVNEREEKLDQIVKKRDFSKTSEPDGREASIEWSKRPVFVIQKHAAFRTHYDFRIENGVLKSWAVPKGPSTIHRKRLAVPTGRPSLEYGDFEGISPKASIEGYILLWDWEPTEI